MCIFFRTITKEELHVIKKLLEYYMNCELEKLPHEMLLSQTIANSGSKWNTYKHCLIDETNEKLPSIYRDCLNFLPHNCTQIAGTAMESHCHWYKYQAEISSGYESVWEYMEKPQNLNPSYDASMKQAFSRYVNCIHSPDVTSALKYCIPKIKKQCQSSSIIAAKILRVNIWNLDFILNDHPDWKVVHQIRDPRGILISQRSSGIMTKYSQGSIIAESSILCDKMLNDTKSFKLYNNTHQSQYMLVKYEDYADAPMQTAQNIYSHIGSEVNEEVIFAIKELTHASHDSGAMDQRRKNSSETARKWTTKMTSIEKKWIDKSCSDFYKESGYREDVNLRPMSYRPISFVEDIRRRNYGRDWVQDYHTQNRIRNGEFGVHRVDVNPSDEKLKSRPIRNFMDDLRSRNSPNQQQYKYEHRNTGNEMRTHQSVYGSSTANRQVEFFKNSPNRQQYKNEHRNTDNEIRTHQSAFGSSTGNRQVEFFKNSPNRQQYKNEHRNTDNEIRTHQSAFGSSTGNRQVEVFRNSPNRQQYDKYEHRNTDNEIRTHQSVHGSGTGNRQIAVSKNSAYRTDNHQFRGYPRNSNSVLGGNSGGNVQENYVRHIGGF